MSPFSEFEKSHRDMVAIDSAGRRTGSIVDLTHHERAEMYTMAKASRSRTTSG